MRLFILFGIYVFMKHTMPDANFADVFIEFLGLKEGSFLYNAGIIVWLVVAIVGDFSDVLNSKGVNHQEKNS